jgi:hypothetical protein
MSEIKVPLLLCIHDTEKMADVMVKFDEWQKKHHGCGYRRPFYLESKEPEVRGLSPDTERQLVEETNREMASNTDIKARIK